MPHRNGVLHLVVLAELVCAVYATSLSAKTSDRALPAKADGSKFSGDIGPDTKSQLDGKVIITQGSLKITGTHADIYTGHDGEVSRAVVTGEAAHIEQLDDQNLLTKADANTIDYTVDTGIAVLTGSAHAQKQTGGEVAGDVLHYDVGTGKFEAASTGASLVHVTFYPKAGAPANSGK